MADETLNFQILVDRNEVTEELKKIQTQSGRARDEFGRFVKTSERSTQKFVGSVGALKIALGGVAAFATGKLVSAFSKAGSEIEDLTVQFSTLLGGVDEAQKRMEELSKFAQTTPFELKQVSQASRVLETLTKGALSTGDGLRLVGDAAATAGEPFEALAIHVGRAYSGLQANRPIGESIARLQELGLVTGDVRNQVEELQKAGRGKEAWEVLRAQLKRSEGGMEALSHTMTGLSSTFKDQLGAAMRQLLEGGVWDGTRNGLQSLVDGMNGILDSGVLVRVGAGFQAVFSGIVNFVSIAANSVWEFTFRTIENTSKVASWLLNKLGNKEWAQKFADSATLAQGMGDEFAKSSQENADAIIKAYEGVKTAINAPIESLRKGFGDTGTQAKQEKPEDMPLAGIPGQKKIDKQLEAIAEAHRAYQDLSRTQMEIENADLQEWYNEQMQIVGDNQQAQLELFEVFKSKETDIAKKYNDIQAKNELEKFQVVSGVFGSISDILKVAAKEHKEFAIASKMFAIGETIIQTYLGAQKAFTSLAGTGPQGPVLGAIAAASAIALGIANVAKIASTSFQSGGIIPGTNTTGDTTMVRANAGEMILSRANQETLFNLLSGGRSNGSGGNRSFQVNIYGNTNENTVQDMLHAFNAMMDERELMAA